MLDYESPKPRYLPTPEDGAWRLRRLGYYGSQLLLFFVIVCRLGPNLILFHSPFSPGPAGYVRYTKDYIPIIAAIKAYNRDWGQLPLDSNDLPPAYQPPNFQGDVGEILGTTSITFPVGAHGVLEYEFSPVQEGWYIHSPRYDGPLPAPIVVAAPKPTTQATTQPTAQPSSGSPLNTTNGH